MTGVAILDDPAPVAGAASTRRRRALGLALLYALYVAMAVLLQYSNSAFLDDFSGYNDEPSHYVTALMVKDYAAAHFPRGPMRFAETFYIHYPKMALGHWPPVGYVIFASWMLVFGDGRTSALILLACLAAACALLLFVAARRVLSLPSAHVIAVFFVVLPMVQAHYSMIMLEIPLVLLSMAATLAFIRFVERDTWADAAWAGVLTGLAIMVKGNAWALPAVFVLTTVILPSRSRPRSGRQAAVFILVALISVPFTLWSMKMVQDGWLDNRVSWQYTMMSFPTLGLFMIASIGPVLAACAAAGFWSTVVCPWRQKRLTPFWATWASSAVGIWVFHAVVPTSVEPRKVLAATPALLLLAGAGLDWIAERMPRRVPPLGRRLGVAVAATLAYAVTSAELVRGYCPGFVRVARFLNAKPELRDVGYFISSNTDGEGRFIAEVASHDRRPQHVVIRSSKAVVKTNWLLTNYELRYRTPIQIREALDRMGVAIVAIHNEPRRSSYPHHDLVLQAIRGNPAWRLVYSDVLFCSRHSKGEEIEIYSFASDPYRKLSHVEVDVENKLGRTLTAQ